MWFYIFRVLFPALLIDLGWAAWLLKKRRRLLAITLPALAYLICTVGWQVSLFVSDPAFRGQGVLGLIVLGYMSFAVSILRIILGSLLWLIVHWVRKGKL